MHDTHGQYNKMPKLSPQELSRMKAEKDARETSERRRNEEQIARQHQMQQAQRAQAGGTPVAVSCSACIV